MALDVVIAVLGVLAALRGWRKGAAVQLLAICGFLIGLGAGAALVVLIAPHLHGETFKTLGSIVVLVLPAAIMGMLGTHVGARVARVARHARLGMVDAAIGSSISLAGTLLVCWLFASVLVNTSSQLLSREIESSHIVRAVQRVMPPVPDAFAAVERYLSSSGFPQVLVNVLPESVGPLRVATRSEVRLAMARDKASVVKVVAIGCGDEQEGSGFIADADNSMDLIVTNAHVVAGTTEISVYAPDGRFAVAMVVLYDPKFDLAILKTPALGAPALPVNAAFVERGTPAIELGYPEGGPYTADGAGIIARFAAQGRDIYEQSLTVRTVYELQAVVRPGNSGGPLVSPSGRVEGVVFSRSASENNIGFALASPGVLRRIDEARTQPDRLASTQGCTS